MSLYFGMNTSRDIKKAKFSAKEEKTCESQLTAFQIQHTLLFIHGILGQVHITCHRRSDSRNKTVQSKQKQHHYSCLLTIMYQWELN